MKNLLLAVTISLPAFLYAQEKENTKDVERIIITKKNSNNEKLNIVVDGEKVTVNGKPIGEDEGDVTVKRMKIKDAQSFNWTPEGDFGNNFPTINRQIQIARAAAPNKAMLGVTTEKAEGGVTIKSVSEESAAQKAGLKDEDIIKAVNGKKIEAPDELSEALKDKKPGDKVEISYIRDGKSHSTTAELTKWKAPEIIAFNNMGGENLNREFDINELFKGFQNEQGGNNNRNFYFRSAPGIMLNSNASAPKLGIKIQDTETGAGVKVLTVEKGSDADRAGLKENDIIKEANGEAINSTDDLTNQKNKMRAGSTIKLKVDRNGRSQNIDVLLSRKIKTSDL